MGWAKRKEEFVGSGDRFVQTGTLETVAKPPAPAANIGICATCLHLGNCAFRRTPNTVVWNCDEFEVEQRAAPTPGPRTEEAIPDPDFQGLCATCSDRHVCSMSHARGGVWHCEEYR
jgi:hypothetical protein